jgi:hypothetical protein
MNSFAAYRKQNGSKTGAGFSEETRAARFARWERVGVELVRADLRNGGRFVVGGGATTRALAEEWLSLKDAERAEWNAASRQADGEKIGLTESLKRIWTELATRLQHAFRDGLHQH